MKQPAPVDTRLQYVIGRDDPMGFTRYINKVCANKLTHGCRTDVILPRLISYSVRITLYTITHVHVRVSSFPLAAYSSQRVV